MQPIHILGQLGIKFKNNFLGMCHIGRNVAYTGTKNHFTIVEHFSHLNNGIIQFSVCSIAEFLGEFR